MGQLELLAQAVWAGGLQVRPLLVACPRTRDVIIRRSAAGLEPLHALYTKNCLSAIEAALQQGKRRVVSFLPSVSVQEIPQALVAMRDPFYASFSNINTPQEYHQLRETEKNRQQGTLADFFPQLRSAL